MGDGGHDPSSSSSSVVIRHGGGSGTDGDVTGSVTRSVITPAQEFAKKYRTEIGASMSSGVSTLVAFPLDSVKTRMQAYKFRSFWDCVTQTKRNEGISGFWRGSLAPLASVTLVRTISFSIYSKSKQFYSGFLHSILGDDLISTTNAGFKPANPLYWFMSGATSGGLITFIACPFEFTKLSAQIELLMLRSKRSSIDDPTHRPKDYVRKGTIQSAKDIIKARGPMGLYSGFHLHLMRDSLGTAMYFTFYEGGKTLLGSSQGAGPLAIAASGGMCGLLSWVLIYPIDSAKSIYQRDVLTHAPGEPIPKRRITLFSRRMYRGLGVSMTRSCILNSVFFSSYEYIKRNIDTFAEVDPI
ncbi:mitochondrial carrier [Ascodesmis nigricans]|uniref:Mitochondrial carrier n=1 Tax=Ascodesmis nigricans TaxID=341454 RepID=A0A4S2MKQ7_9PEZI|nr:mitochondrial carrier [Ascodesmis nigricans]